MSDRAADPAPGRASLAFPGSGMQLNQLPAAIRLMRPHHWIKNGFVAAPLFFTPSALSVDNLVLVLIGMASLCMVASAVYILNDYMDRQADRMHPVKRLRPIASGEVSSRTALVLFALLVAGGLGTAFSLDPSVGMLVSAYFLMNISYSLGLKDVSIVDVLIITMGFVLRVFVGATLITVVPSVWIIMCTGLVALFLALAKRRDDLVQALGQNHRRSLEGYTKPFLDASLSMVLGALLIAYMMYTTDDAVAAQTGKDQLYLTVPFVVAGILRYMQIVLVEERSGAPTVVVLTDRFLIGCMTLWAGSFALLLYL